MYILNGIPLSPNKAFTHNGIKYPANWLELSTESEKISIGITAISPQLKPSYDSRFYNLSSSNSIVEKSLNDYNLESGELPVSFSSYVPVTQNNSPGLKTIWKKEQDEKAYELLSSTDWYVTRKSEIGVDIPVGITSYRNSVRDICEQRKIALDSATSMSEFIGVTTFSGMDWPEL